MAYVSKADLEAEGENPGFPFFVPGVAGQRVPHPPLDFAPQSRHGNQEVVNGVARSTAACRAHSSSPSMVPYEQHNAWDFTKENDKLLVEVPEEGTAWSRLR